ncbi:MAG: VOC family protein [Magnetospirillum sp.]
MRLGYTILYVEDVTRSVDFYQRAFGLEVDFVHESGDFAQMATGQTALAFTSRGLMAQLGKTPQAADPHQPCFEIALVCDDVAAALDHAVAAGAQLIQSPKRMDWGQDVAYVADPDGFWVEICSPVGG